MELNKKNGAILYCSSFLLVFIFVLSGCNKHFQNKKRIETPLEKIELNIKGASGDKIVFLTFKIMLKDSAIDNYDVKVINSIIADGKLKQKGIAEPNDIQFNYLYIECSAIKSGEKRFEKVKNPLIMDYEFSGEENGGLEKALVRKKSGEFVFRFQYDASKKYLSIFKPVNDSHMLKIIYRGEIVQ